ncbi:hypothetical protein I6U33_05265 [Pseudomonas carnis]|uniref:hypothetical protein n=1 Tax=Pseudomonas TaxID=286 RepID=UPI0018E78550|nr:MULTISPECIES: hypothetical protein [Pseudomonas]MBJ2225766.1 hypothetical protein [Pseudomonas sp. MF7451]MBW9236733.1 hypothetical protein [Pseudomonas carnis]
MIRELIEKAKTADKDDLLDMLKDLGLKADQRKGEDTLRAELLAGLEKALADEVGDETAPNPDLEPGNAGTAGLADPKTTGDPDAGTDSAAHSALGDGADQSSGGDLPSGDDAVAHSDAVETVQVAADPGLGRHVGPVTLNGEDGQLYIPQALVDEMSIPGINMKLVGGDPPTASALREVQAPDLEDVDDDHESPAPVTGNRLLRNTRTGCEFVWTTELAKLSYMQEV